MSLNGQTGTGRQLSRYSHTLAADLERYMRKIVNTTSMADKEAAAAACGRGMLNFQKAFPIRGDEWARWSSGCSPTP